MEIVTFPDFLLWQPSSIVILLILTASWLHHFRRQLWIQTNCGDTYQWLGCSCSMGGTDPFSMVSVEAKPALYWPSLLKQSDVKWLARIYKLTHRTSPRGWTPPSQISPITVQRRPAYENLYFCYATTGAESEQPVGAPFYQWVGCRDHAGITCFPHSGSWQAQGGPAYICRGQRKCVFIIWDL